MHYLNEQNIFIFLIQVFLLLGLARGLGIVFTRWKQPPLTAEILVGIMLGPTVFGRSLPHLHRALFPADMIQQSMLETVAWLGVLFLLLETGLEIDFSSAWRQKGDALKIALSDIVIPMVIAFIPSYLLPAYYLVDPGKRFIFALFMATVMTISAMPITARALHDLKLLKTDLGFLIMSALSVNDILGWVIFTLVLGSFTQTALEPMKVFVMLGIVAGFTIFCVSIGRAFSNAVIKRIREKQLPETGISLTFICLLGLLCGAVTQRIGIHALFGFFIAGIMVGEAPSLSEKARQVISQMVHAIFVPLFFANIGLKVDFLRNFDIFLVLLVSIIGISGRFLGAWIGVNFTALSRINRLPIAIAHIPGGTMEIVVAVLALENRLITEPVFVAIVFGALLSSVMLGPWLSYSIRRRKEVSVLEFFLRRAIIPVLQADERDAAIEELCGKVAEQEEIPGGAEALYKAVVKRENEMGTAMEEGIAVPHARLPFLKRPVVAFGRSVAGIEWNSPDGKPANFIFLILTSQEDVESQVQILSLIARGVSDEKAREAIMEAVDSQQIWEALEKALASRHIKRTVSS